MKTRFSIFHKFLIIISLCFFSFNINAIDHITKSNDKIEGGDSEDNVEFSSAITGQNFVTISIEVNSKKIIAEIDYDNQRIILKSISSHDNKPVIINKKDKELLESIKDQLPPVNSIPEDALMSVLNLVLEYPNNKSIDYDSTKKTGKDDVLNASPQAASPSLCDNVGETITGNYTVQDSIPGKQCIKHARQVRGAAYVYYECQESAVVGPCWNEANSCMGRCGSGCAGESETIQRFTQNCLNHDLCRNATDQNWGPCLDEWLAAADDFVFAKDCGNATGKWQDNYSYAWNLKQQNDLDGFKISGKISGDVLVQNNYLRCSTWKVSGTHQGASIKLTATNPLPIETGCCTIFRYAGKANSCNTATGTWDNDCGLKGSWIMFRAGSQVSMSTMSDSDSASDISPASDGQNTSK